MHGVGAVDEIGVGRIAGPPEQPPGEHASQAPDGADRAKLRAAIEVRDELASEADHSAYDRSFAWYAGSVAARSPYHVVRTAARNASRRRVEFEARPRAEAWTVARGGVCISPGPT